MAAIAALIAAVVTLVLFGAMLTVSRLTAASGRIPGFDLASLTGIFLVFAGLSGIAWGSVTFAARPHGNGVASYIDGERKGRAMRETVLYSLVLIAIGALLVIGSPVLEAGATAPSASPSSSPVDGGA